MRTLGGLAFEVINSLITNGRLGQGTHRTNEWLDLADFRTIADRMKQFKLLLKEKQDKNHQHIWIIAEADDSNLVKNLNTLTYITNSSFTERAFSSEIKITQVLPLHKSNDPMLFNN